MTHAYLQKEIFEEWEYDDPIAQNKKQKDHATSPMTEEQDQEVQEDEEEGEGGYTFEVSLTSFLDCLNIFGTASKLKANDKDGKGDEDGEIKIKHRGRGKSEGPHLSGIRISYLGLGNPLMLIIEDHGVVTRCELTTYDPSEMRNNYFEEDERLVRVITKCDILRSAMLQFDDKTLERITLTFTPQSFKLEAEGVLLSSSKIELPNDSGVLDEIDFCEEQFEDGCEMVVKNSYKIHNLLKIRKALELGTKASLRTDRSGFLSLQFMVPVSHQRNRQATAYVEMMLHALEDNI